jgi:hypothetical protein
MISAELKAALMSGYTAVKPYPAMGELWDDAPAPHPLAGWREWQQAEQARMDADCTNPFDDEILAECDESERRDAKRAELGRAA